MAHKNDLGWTLTVKPNPDTNLELEVSGAFSRPLTDADVDHPTRLIAMALIDVIRSSALALGALRREEYRKDGEVVRSQDYEVAEPISAAAIQAKGVA